MILIRNLILVSSLMCWLVVGLIVWIPLLIRSIAVFIVAILHAALTNEPSNSAAELLNKSISFYIDGFRRICEAFKSADTQPIRANIHLLRLFTEIGWALFFWLMTIGLPILLSNGTSKFNVFTKNSIDNETFAKIYIPQLKEFTKNGNVSSALSAMKKLMNYPTASAVPDVISALDKFHQSAEWDNEKLDFSQKAIKFLDDLKAKEACDLLSKIAISSNKLNKIASETMETICRMK
jgi:hypothetical protein